MASARYFKTGTFLPGICGILQTIYGTWQGESWRMETPWTKEDWKRWQAADPGICSIQSWVKVGRSPQNENEKVIPREVKLLEKEWDRLEIIDRILVRQADGPVEDKI